MAALSKAIAGNKDLVHVDLGGNNVGPAGAKHLGAALRDNKGG